MEPEKKNYRTQGREALIDYLAHNPDCQFTADELFGAVKSVTGGGKSSVYRQLAGLCDDAVVRKFRSEARNCSVYQYIGAGCDCRTHFHEKCVICGKIEHLECDASAEFAAHLLREHGFTVDCGSSILYGVCASCREKQSGAGERSVRR